MEIVIHYGKSANALRLAKFFNQEPSLLTITTETIKNNPELLWQFCNAVKNLKSTCVFVDGKMQNTKSTLAMIICACGYYGAISPKDYCELWWPCKQLTFINLDNWTNKKNTKYWWEFGDWLVKYTVWKFGKDEIKECLRREAELKHLDICPQFSLEKSLKVIDDFPDTVNLHNTKEWELNQIKQPGMKLEIFGVMPSRALFREQFSVF